jgi:hypothetical protein
MKEDLKKTIRVSIVGVHGNSSSRTGGDPKILVRLVFDGYFNALVDSDVLHPLLAVSVSLVDQLGIG